MIYKVSALCLFLDMLIVWSILFNYQASHPCHSVTDVVIERYRLNMYYSYWILRLTTGWCSFSILTIYLNSAGSIKKTYFSYTLCFAGAQWRIRKFSMVPDEWINKSHFCLLPVPSRRNKNVPQLSLWRIINGSWFPWFASLYQVMNLDSIIHFECRSPSPLQKSHMSIMTSHITGNSTLCSSTSLCYKKETTLRQWSFVRESCLTVEGWIFTTESR